MSKTIFWKLVSYEKSLAAVLKELPMKNKMFAQDRSISCVATKKDNTNKTKYEK